MSEKEREQIIKDLAAAIASQPQPKTGLVENLKARVPTIASIIVACVGATWWAGDWFSSFKGQLNRIESRINWSWRVSDQRMLEREFYQLNPGSPIKFPNADEVRAKNGAREP